MRNLTPSRSGESACELLEQYLVRPLVPFQEAWEPCFFKLQAGEYPRFAALCRKRGLRQIDEYQRQLFDLAAVRHPGGNLSEWQRFVHDFVSAEGDYGSSGTWVLLPWEYKIVHLLDEDPYFEVITNRNCNKITAAEQRLLRKKTVGVMGLSVGGEAAVAVAQEHLCGHMVLADFDRLDLSNLNRIDAGFDELGLAKTTITARRIGKLNPYLKVTLYEAGVVEANVTEFLQDLDLLIEECDGLRMKSEVRLRARQLGVNIVFAGDERGFLSVEPYEQRPDLPPFHGRITGPQRPREEFSDTRDFLKQLTEWLGGFDEISDRSRDSLARVGADLCGYPQLASEARFAAGQIGHVARRLLLGEQVRPFLGHIDLDQLVPSNGE